MGRETIKSGAAILACLLLLLAGCGASGGEEKAAPRNDGKEANPIYGDIIIEGSIGDASNLIPILASDGSSHGISNLIFNGLVKYDKNIKIVGDLADSWEISDSGLVVTFHLRKNVRWHDGRPFTADDVLYTYGVTIDPKTPTAYAGDFQKITKAEIIDPYTFRVTYDEPFAPALISWSASILPKHLLEGQDITKTPLSRSPVGTGPYKFKEWVAGQKIVLAANNDYFEGRPYIDGYIMRVIPDTATMFLELRAQGIDQMGLTPLQYTRQTENNLFRRHYEKYRYLAFAYTYLGFNLDHPFFRDKRVRQAIAHAINKEEIIDGVLLGMGRTASGPYKPGTWPYNDKVKKYPYDPGEARRLLADAGWRDGDGDGVLDKNGTPFRFEIITNQGNDLRAKCAEIIQRRCSDIGVDVKIRIIEWAAFVNEFINKKKFDATILGWNITPDPDLFDVWHSSKTKPGELNFVSYRNDEVDRLLERGRSTFDQEERKRCYQRFQEILAEDQPYCFLYVPEALPIVSSRFRGIEAAPAGISHNFIKWHVPKAEQRYVMQP
ncbi:MAG: peptide-binding protein [Deltaproteobacteria bacterium]|nr:peptide-binding protein [Deltaproteobacteria bacterium]